MLTIERIKDLQKTKTDCERALHRAEYDWDTEVAAAVDHFVREGRKITGRPGGFGAPEWPHGYRVADVVFDTNEAVFYVTIEVSDGTMWHDADCLVFPGAWVLDLETGFRELRKKHAAGLTEAAQREREYQEAVAKLREEATILGFTLVSR